MSNALSWNDFASALCLDEATALRCREHITRLKQDFFETMRAPVAGGGASPLEYLAQQLRQRLNPARPHAEQPVAMSQAYWEFVKYGSEHRDAEQRQIFTKCVQIAVEHAIQAVENELDQQQGHLFRTHFAHRLMDIDVGVDPFSDAVAARIAAAAGSADAAEENVLPQVADLPLLEEQPEMALDELALALSLDDAQAQALRARLNALKDEVVMLFTREDGQGETPAGYLRGLLTASAGDVSPAVYQSFLIYLGNASPEAESGSYRVLLNELETRAAREILVLLSPAQAGVFRHFDTSLLPGIITGYDPLGALTAPLNAQGARIHLDTIGQFVGLDARQLHGIQLHLDRLKDDFVVLISTVPAEGGPSPLDLAAEAAPEAMAAVLERASREKLHPHFKVPFAEAYLRLEAERREAVFDFLNIEQRQRFLKLGIRTLLDIETGHDPLYEEISRRRARAAGRAQRDVPADLESLATWITAGDQNPAPLRDTVLQLRGDVVRLQSTPSAETGSSPISLLAARMAGGSPTAASQEFLRCLGAWRPAGQTRTYALLAQERAWRAHADIGELLAPAARERWRLVSPRHLLKITLLDDPLAVAIKGELRAQARQSESARADEST